jgi:transposase
MEACGSADRPTRLPMQAEPRDGEALCSWLIRLGNRIGMTPLDTTRRAFGIDSSRRPEWWRRPSSAELAALANKSDSALKRVRAMTLLGWAETRCDERHERFCAPGFWCQRTRPAALRPLAMCGLCLAADNEPYIRTEWMIGWTAVCAKHRAILVGRCPSCGAALSLPGLSMRREVRIGRCDRCDRMLDRSRVEPALDAVCDTQDRLLALKRAGSGDLPGLGPIAWETFVGLADLVLSALWRPRARHARERLFTRVVRDSGLDPEERLQIDWPSNYGAMLILAWLLAGWPQRMTEATDLLRAPRLDELIALVTDVGGEPDVRLAAMLADVIPDRPSPEEEWRRWLESLPETAEMLRQRARWELRYGVSKKLSMLADLRDGMDPATVADRAGLRVVTVERWLDIGLEYGLAALTAEQMRISRLTDDQRHAITTWLDSVSRMSKGPNAWCAEHAQQEIAVRFGVLLSAAAVLHLLRETPRLRFDRGIRGHRSSSSRFKEPVHV